MSEKEETEEKLTGADIGAGAFTGNADDVSGAIEKIVGAAKSGARPSSGGSAALNVAGVPVASATDIKINSAPMPTAPALPGFRKGQFRTVNVVLTYSGLDLPPIIFPCRARMSDEAAEAHDAFQGLPTDQRAAKRFAHHLAIMSGVIIGEPAGIDDFPAPRVPVAVRGMPGFEEYKADLEARFNEYFNDPDDEFITSILQAAYNRYFMRIIPREYL